MKVHQEDPILETAIQALRAETGIVLHRAQASGPNYDAILTLKGTAGSPNLEFAAEVKPRASQANFGALVHQLKSLPYRPLLVADYINPNMAARLKEHGIAFVDTCGNAYIDAKAWLFIFSKGNKPTKDVVSVQLSTASAMGRALEPSGLKVVFAFLCDPELVARPYRDIALAADVAVGTVGWVIRGLKESRYLLDRGSLANRRLVRPSQLLARWVENYPLKLRPKLSLGQFFTPEPRWWKTFDPVEYDAYWGEEVAGARLTKNLQPEVATLYLPEHRLKKLAMSARLRKSMEPTGAGMQVKIYRKFWNPQKHNADPALRGLVPPILAYADLIATGDPRNTETARLLYEQWIAGPDWQD